MSMLALQIAVLVLARLEVVIPGASVISSAFCVTTAALIS